MWGWLRNISRNSAIDYNTNGAVKLVDRLEFSTNNFSADVVKGWER